VLAGQGHVERRGDVIEIEFDGGDLRPGEPYQTRLVTVIADESAPAELPITMTVRALSAKGSTSRAKTLVVSPAVSELSDWVDSG
jgi:hypothetical protein